MQTQTAVISILISVLIMVMGIAYHAGRTVTRVDALEAAMRKLTTDFDGFLRRIEHMTQRKARGED